MPVLDTNIFIYIAKGRLSREQIKGVIVQYASVTRIEALGFGSISVNEEHDIESMFEAGKQLDLDRPVIEYTIGLRQLYKLDLGDAIIAATAMTYDTELWTANTKDFANIEGLRLHNPLAV